MLNALAHSPITKRCHCGRMVEMRSDPTRCACGQFYNLFGQSLAHPRQWGEETGERFDDDGNQIL